SNPESNGELEKFLEDLNTKILFAYEQAHETGLSSEFRNVCLSTRYEDVSPKLGVAVVFIKIGVGELAAETMSGRVVTTTVDVTHPMRGLRGVLREAFSKVGKDWWESCTLTRRFGSWQVDVRIFRLRVEVDFAAFSEELVSGLEACISRGSLSENFDEDNIDNIMIPYDELAFWTQCEQAGKEGGERVSKIAKELSECRSAAPMLFDHSSPQERGQSSLAALYTAIEGVLPLLENISLDEKINPPYPVKRMKRLLMVISYKICAEVSWHLAEVKDIFQPKDKRASMVVREALKVLERWIQCVQDGQLLSESPVESAKEGARGPEFNSRHSPYQILASPLRLADRIRCVNSLQLQQQQLRSIAADATSPITPAEVQSLIEDLPQADNHSLFGVSDYSETIWKEFFGRYARKAEPMVLRLKPLIDRQLAAPSGDAASTVASVTGQFGAMLDFPILRENLKSERQTILMMLKRELDELEDSLGRSRSVGYLEDLHKLAMMRGKVDLLAAGLAPSSGFLRDLPGASEALSKCRGMSMLVKGRKDTLFKRWCVEMSSNSSVWLDTSASVIKTSSDGGGDLEVAFDSRLLFATKEARAFTNAGYQIPKNLSAE
ncbi:Cytoplasmic dynein 2 heavy chain 1, partial [Perkinsus olseni]